MREDARHGTRLLVLDFQLLLLHDSLDVLHVGLLDFTVIMWRACGNHAALLASMVQPTSWTPQGVKRLCSDNDESR